MQPAEWFLISRNRLGMSEFFLRSPFRSLYFLGATITLSVGFIFIGIVVVKYLQRLDFFVAMGLFLAVGATLFLWRLALEIHRGIRFVLTMDQQSPRIELGSELHKILSATAFMINLGLFYVSLITIGYLVVLSEVLRRG
ncbi:MAG TPA: hypothetical protein VOA88_00730 [Candidatus Dormibacteraeota bacterium]|nr:hypothetical protein [Candidatus Dormibacteraeota bacterium]